MARPSLDEIELAQPRARPPTSEPEPEALSYGGYEPRRIRARPGTDQARASVAFETHASSSIEPENNHKEGHRLASASSALPSPTPTLAQSRPSWPRRLLRFTAGPRAGSCPLPVAAPLLTVAYTAGHSHHAWKPDETVIRVWTYRLRRWGKRNPWKKGLLLGLWLTAWIISFAFLVRANSFLSRTEPNVDGGVQQLGCTSTFWGARDSCGLDGAECQSTGSLAFRCPGGCVSQILYNPRAIGSLTPDRVTLVIGGGDALYRADSFVCSSAVHAGLISPSTGGCGILNLFSYPEIANSTYPASDAHGIQSIPFPAPFPNAFGFTPCRGHHCTDLRWEILGVHMAFAILLGLLFDPPPLVWFWTLACLGFWNVILVSDSRSQPPDMSDAFGDFLPYLFICYSFWRVAFQHTLPSFLAHLPIETVIFSLGGFVPGMLLNVVSERIPIDTLTAGDISSDALGWVIGLIVALVLLVCVQVRWMWKTGWLRFYAGWTIACGLVIVVLSQLPDLTFRLHHYVFAIMFIGALCFATRTSLVLQCLLLGIAANGIGKFGLESVLQTADELRRDAALDSSIPTFITNSTTWNGAINSSAFANNTAVQWDSIPGRLADSWDGFSLLVDDVERYVGSSTNYSLSGLSPLFPHFFRIAYQRDGTSGAFSKAATAWPNGTWTNPQPGAS